MVAADASAAAALLLSFCVCRIYAQYTMCSVLLCSVLSSPAKLVAAFFALSAKKTKEDKTSCPLRRESRGCTLTPRDLFFFFTTTRW